MGQKQAAFDESGTFSAFYDTDDSPAPTGVSPVDISDDLWMSLLVAQGQGMRIIKGDDGAPVSADPLPPTAAQTVAANTIARDALNAAAVTAMTPLLLALQLGNATAAQKSSATAWQSYYAAVNAIDLTQSSPAWPSTPTA